ncbi:hypothetical protein V565_024400 [Rhizoctonia solani 123E]|uniref:Uncharacterized protein n=1 Tax=Rhizoctonia solani 123E TaxID=1423351 RepID=A0A074SAK7_9AGAM|nr:hypothetical protein V565_024400 [Rhizoctonia solani 123E]
MSATLSPTLYYDLTSPKPGVTRTNYPATDLIYKLLNHTGADVSSFRRNCQVSYRLIEYARDLYDEINSRILKAEESGSWEHYDAYYRAIDPLEEELLSIMDVTEAERDEYLIGAALPELSEKPVEAWIKQSISDWQERRTRIRESLKGLRARQEFKDFITSPDDEVEIESAKTHDDRTLLQNLLRSIGDNESKVARGKPQNAEMVKKVKEGLQSALDFLKGSPKKALEEELSVMAIKSAMITYGVTELMKDDEIKKHPELYNRLYSETIWKTAQTLAANLHDNLKRNDAAPNLAGLNKTYEELEAALTGEVPILMPDAYVKLFPLVGKIGRAYHAQSLVLASLCYKVASHYKDNKVYEARDTLESALEKTIRAFTAAGGLNSRPTVNGADHAANGASTNGAMSNGTVPEITGYDGSCEELYDESISEIASCYNAMKVNDDSDPKKQLEEARNKDQVRLQTYKSRFTRDVPARGLVNLTLFVYNDDSNGEHFREINAKVLQTARLSYIKWLATKELKEAELSHFELPAEKQLLHLDAEIQNLATGNQCTLHLILHKEEPKADENQ